MRSDGAGRFAASAVAIAAVAGAVVAWLFRSRGDAAVAWALTGWGIMALVGVVSGWWMVRNHGRPGSGFLAALAAGMLARLFLSAAGAGWAAWHGVETVWVYLGGLLAGYLPLQAFELTWFVRRGRTRP